MLNCEESKSLRGVERLLTSNTGIGDVSLVMELEKKEKILIRKDYMWQYYSECQDLKETIIFKF